MAALRRRAPREDRPGPAGRPPPASVTAIFVRPPAPNPGGLLAWTIGSAIGIYLIADGQPAGVTWALTTTFTVSGALYALALAVARPGWFVTARPNEPRLEVHDPWQQRILCETCERAYVAVEMDRRPDGPHAAICSQCATGYGFHRAAQVEARAG